MTKVVKNWKERVALYFENRAKKDKIEEIELSKESIIDSLLYNKTTEQSLEVFESISKQFNNLMQQRLININEEKVAIEKFLS